MAYDRELANRLRELLADEPALTEKAMFGGLAFLVNGNMTVAASGQGGLLVRIDPKQTQAALTRQHAEVMVMRGREMPGWIRVGSEGIKTKRELQRWVRQASAFVHTLPPKG